MANDPVETVPHRSDPHPSLDTWLQYQGGGLPEAAMARLQDHLTDCASCVELVLDIDAFDRPEEPSPRGPVSFERAATWRSLRSAIAREGARPPVPRWTAWRLAAAMAIPILAVAVWAAIEHRTAGDLRRALALHTRPVLNPPVVDLFPDIATRSGQAREVTEVPPASPLTTFILNLAEPVDFPDYGVDILDGSGTSMWSGSGLEMSEFGNFTLGLPQGFLASGTYPVRVYGIDGERRELLEEFQIRIP